MKLCIPSLGRKGLDEQVGEHFGRVPFYTLYDTNSKEVEFLENTSAHMGGTGYPTELIARAGVNTMLCGGLGGRAIQMFEEMGIMVYMGARGTVREAIQLWENGALEPATNENACKEHAFRKEEHEHHHHH